jgi:hypothetical protein
MYTEVRWTLVVVSLALAALPVWMAGRLVTDNLAVLSSWTRAQGKVVGLAADDQVEIELRGEPDVVRANAPIDHKLGLAFLKTVTIYADPADPQHIRVGGWFQMWLWPIGLALGAAVLLICGAAAASIGRGNAAELESATGRWMFSPAPAAMETDIRVHRPASEWKAPLFWSLLGLALLACAVLMRSANPISRMGSGSAGMLFLLLMWGMALDNKTTDVSADRNGLLKSSAFGWCRIRWEQVGSVQQEHTIFGRSESRLRQRDTSFPGRDVTVVVFRDKGGRQLVTLSPGMEPTRNMRRLLDACADRTGLHLEFRTIYDPNF